MHIIICSSHSSGGLKTIRMVFLLYVLLFLLFLLAYRYMKGEPKKGRYIPGPRGWPIIGSAFQIRQPSYLGFSDLAIKYGPIYKMSAMNQNMVVLNSDELVRTLLTKEPYSSSLIGRLKTFYSETMLYGGQSVAFMDGCPTQAKFRKYYNKALHVYGDGIPAFEELVLKQATFLRNKISNNEGKDFDIKETMKIALSNILFILLSGESLAEDDPNLGILYQFDAAGNFLLQPINDAIMRAMPFLKYLPGPGGNAYRSISDAKRKIKKLVVDKTKSTYTANVDRGLLDKLIEMQEDDAKHGREAVITDERLTSMALETAGAGIMTTFSTLTSMFLFLVHYPHCQENIQAEIDTIIGQDRMPALKDRHKMPYTEAVVIETLRHSPAVPLSIPHTCKEDISFDGYEIAKDTVVIINIWHIQHDESVWGDPWVFRPERFLDERGELFPLDHELRQHWMPFSMGRRGCIGETFARSRIFLLVTMLLQKLTFLPPISEDLLSCDPREFCDGIIIQPKPYKLRANLRKF